MRRESGLCDSCFSFAMEELHGEEAQRFSRHLNTCRRCQAEYEDLRKLRQDVEEAMLTKATRSSETTIAMTSKTPAWTAALVLLLVMIVLPHHPQLVGKFRESATDVRDSTKIMSYRIEHVGFEARNLLQRRLELKRPNIDIPIRGL